MSEDQTKYGKPEEQETDETAEQAAEKFAENNYDHITNIKEYSTHNDLLHGFLEGWKAAIEWQSTQQKQEVEPVLKDIETWAYLDSAEAGLDGSVYQGSYIKGYMKCASRCLQQIQNVAPIPNKQQKNRIKELVIAAALVCAQIDKLQNKPL